MIDWIKLTGFLAVVFMVLAVRIAIFIGAVWIIAEIVKYVLQGVLC